MEQNTDNEDRLNKIEKELFRLIKKTIPELQQNSGGSSGIDFQPQIDDLKTKQEQLNTEIENQKTETSSALLNLHTQLNDETQSINQKILQIESTLSNTSNIVENHTSQLESLNSSFQTLKTTVDNIVDVAIPELEQKIQNSSGGGGGVVENWTVIYDRDATDEATHWGYTSGIFSNTVIENAPNFRLYKKLRFYYICNGTRVIKTFDIADMQENEDNFFSIVLARTSGTNQIISANAYIRFLNGSWLLTIMPIYVMKFSNGKYPEVSKIMGDLAYRFTKIEGLPI